MQTSKFSRVVLGWIALVVVGALIVGCGALPFGHEGPPAVTGHDHRGAGGGRPKATATAFGRDDPSAVFVSIVL